VIKSLFLKLVMLSITMAVVFWIRWAPPPPVQDIPSATEKQVIVTQPPERVERESHTAGSSSRNVQGLNIDTVTQTEPSVTPIRSRLDLNRASAGELESLPGIGTVLAQRVIAFRESVGRFQKVEDLREVKGIGAKKFERLKSLVTVTNADLKTARKQSLL
jgi:competence protein ComEA